MKEKILYIKEKEELAPNYINELNNCEVYNLEGITFSEKHTNLIRYMRYKRYTFLIASGATSVHPMMITGPVKILINPIILDLQTAEEYKIREKFDFYLDMCYDTQNEFDNFALFTNNEDINIVKFKQLFRYNHLFIVNTINLCHVIEDINTTYKENKI